MGEQLAHRWVVRGGGVVGSVVPVRPPGRSSRMSPCFHGLSWAVLDARAATQSLCPGAGGREEPGPPTPAGLSLAFVWRLDL